MVVLLGLTVFIAMRYLGLRVWEAVVCILFGFMLAGTVISPDIRRFLVGVFNLITNQ
ncbi:hypothetical protein [Nonomuraea typhae]|uniref:hypothetical protein n=1 Tax=Nonomuraea typhae TaxID=2603600 RepID=UPI001CA4EB87|nr:hypothetical protein [Nonomuraea typhae]